MPSYCHPRGRLESLVGAKNFRIDDPLDLPNRYLVQAAIESDEVLSVVSAAEALASVRSRGA